MQNVNRSYDRSVGDYFGALDAAVSFGERELALGQLVKEFGFGQWVYFQNIDPASATGHAKENFRFVDHRRPAWAEEYDELNLVCTDPAWAKVPLSELPTFYDNLSSLTGAQKRFMDRSRVDGGQTNGIGMIVKRPSGGGAGFAVAERDRSVSGGVALQLLGAVNVFHMFAEAELSAAAARDLGLSFRQMKVIHGLKNGHRRRRIAQIIGTTEGTVNNICRDLQLRLGVQTDASLLMKLASLSVIRP